MEIFLIELILWGGLAFLFWIMKDKLDGVESRIAANPADQQQLPIATGFDHAEQLTDPIGTYCDLPIYSHARIAGKNYEFSHVCPQELHTTMRPNERYLSPGLVYIAC